jgi:hypothetical protein
MEAHKRQRITAGLVLIGLGLALFAMNKVGNIGPWAIFFVVGGAFLAAYFYQREYGFLIPACILMGLGAGNVGKNVFDFDISGQMGLGLGFVAIFVIAFLYERRTHWWPLVPGAILIATSLTRFSDFVEFMVDNWPLALVILGILIMLGAFGRPKPRTPPRAES